MAEWASWVEWSSHSLLSQGLQAGLRYIWTHAVQVCMHSDLCACEKMWVESEAWQDCTGSSHWEQGEVSPPFFLTLSRARRWGTGWVLTFGHWGGKTLPLCGISRKWNLTQ